MSRRVLLSCAVLLCFAPLSACTSTHSEPGAQIVDTTAAPPSRAVNCVKRLEREQLDASIALGTQFLINNQRSEGHFGYAYNWRKRRHVRDDSEVRQAGATWGLALLHRANPTPKLRAALSKALSFFARHARVVGRRRFVAYPGAQHGSLGTVALLALAHIDDLRSDMHATGNTDDRRRTLDQLLAFLVSAHRSDGRFHARYHLDTGEPYGRPSPYFDGEALLALVKAAKYLDRGDLMPLALTAAKAGHHHNVVQALAAEPDSDITKGYYQWSSMAYYELATTNAAVAGSTAREPFASWLLELADWMVDVHGTLRRTRNTAYAYEGIVPAFAIASARGDNARARKLGCVIEAGLRRLSSWQIGNANANAFISAHPTDDPFAIGGVQNHAREPELRIDVVQHQMHALLLARELYLPAAR